MKKQTSAEDFIRSYMKHWGGDNVAQAVADELGLSAVSVYARVKSLRKVGVHLPRSRSNKGYTGKEVTRLNRLIKSLRS